MVHERLDLDFAGEEGKEGRRPDMSVQRLQSGLTLPADCYRSAGGCRLLSGRGGVRPLSLFSPTQDIRTQDKLHFSKSKKVLWIPVMH